MACKENFKIAIIACWMGPLPEYFPMWLKSCADNPEIDFFLYSDQFAEELPENEKLFPSSLQQIQLRIQKKLGFAAEGLVKPYKLCDFRPFYGLIFDDQLKGYSHWGHCDIDLFFGSFRSFVTDALLSRYDKIFQYGHLTIYKNLDVVNRRPMLLQGGLVSATEVFRHKEHYSFDEITGIDRIYRKHKCSYYADTPFVDVSVRHSKSLLINIKERNHSIQAFAYENGRILRYYEDQGSILTDEWLYLHFQKKNMPLNEVDLNEDAFWITPNGLFPKRETIVTSEVILKYNPALSYAEHREEESTYKKRKLLEIFRKSTYEKIIYIKQRGIRALDRILSI